MRYSISKFLCLILLVGVSTGCARRGTPTGGAKDSIPPVLVKAIPEVESINFKENKIKIYFDEYIKLKDVKKKLVISPPQKNEPIITPVGTASKFISIKILDTLDSNTTYTFNFGNSIVDNNEENEFRNFKYVFSTGDYIDSLNLSGDIFDPIEKEPTSNIDVMLYEYNNSFSDSIIYKQKPRYIANTLDSTNFEFTNLRAGKYLLIALKDVNGNKIYDPKIDKIGFILDTVSLPTDKKYSFPIFKEIPDLKVIRPKEASKGHIIFGYEGIAKNVAIELLTKTPENFNYHINYEKDKDTLNYWYTPFEVDSLNFNVHSKDYTEDFSVTLRTSKIDSLKIQQSTSGILHLLDTLFIATNTPIVDVDSTLIKILDQDSTYVNFNTFLNKSKTKLFIDFEKKYNNEYNVELLPKTLTDIFGISNDTLTFNAKTKTLEDYGNIIIEITNSENNALIVELLNDKNTVVRTSRIQDTKTTVKFNTLEPGNYFIRVIIDTNNNGIWDTGSYLKRVQPEKIKHFEKQLELRANWDLNETFTIN